jgi:hypothetical protein
VSHGPGGYWHDCKTFLLDLMSLIYVIISHKHIDTEVIIKIFIQSDACNPRYSGGRDQEDHSLKPVPGK